jgi:Fe-S cluster assembly protein SufD
MSAKAMTIVADEADSWVDNYQSISPAGNHLPWLQAQRENALKRFAQLGLPGIRDEQWRYTNLRALKSNAYSVSAPSSLIPSQLEETDQPRLVFVNGHFRSDLSELKELGPKVSLLNLATALTDESSDLADNIANYFGKSLPQETHGFSVLNTAYARDGYVLVLEPGAVCEQVIEICYFNHGESQEASTVSHIRNLIIAKANSQCTIVERHMGDDGSVYLSNAITEIHAHENAHVDHYKLLRESDNAFHIGGVYINQDSSSHVKNHSIALGGLVSRNDIYCNLNGQGAHIEMNGLVLGKNRQHVDNHTEVHHVVPNCTSDEYYKTILDDHSRSVFRGRIIVAEDAQLTNADQQNNNLILSPHAEADSKPQLEIYADDVKCSHGATVGQLDAKSMFYLRSRGIDAESARALLTFAFANEVIDRIKVDAVRTELTQTIAGQLLAGLEDLV